MKNTRKLAAFVASILAVACMAAPMATSFSADAASHTITIKAPESDKGTHTYVAYQIFKGTYEGGVLKDITWGAGVNGEALLTALKGDTTLGTLFAECKSASDVADVLGSTTGEGESVTSVFEDDAAKTQAFAKLVAANKTTTSIAGNANVITVAEDGYYLVMDSAAPSLGTGADNSGAYTRYIVKVTDKEAIEVTAKAAAPTVDKQVQDEAADKEEGADNDGWGESADHAINEEFKFKLTATLPVSTEYNAYETYKVIFNDTMSAGVTYDGIDSVTVDGITIDESAYEVDGVNTGDAGKTWTLTIANIKGVTGVDLTDGASVVVTYKAHLNENAIVSKTSDTGLDVSETNNNKVSLNYSNNPNVSGDGHKAEGTTPEDYVWVFTYEAFNKKVDSEKTALEGAEFRLYSDEACETEIGLIYDDGLSAYRPVNTDETATVMTSAATTGAFNIAGLDIGTYYLKETKAPAGGYNLLQNATPFTITATHKESAAQTVDLTLDGNFSESAPLEIVNKKGSSLPSTGGIGTTIFYVAGGALVVGAGVLLVSKKRMSNK